MESPESGPERQAGHLYVGVGVEGHLTVEADYSPFYTECAHVQCQSGKPQQRLGAG